MRKKSEDIILLSANRVLELDKYHESRIRAQQLRRNQVLWITKLIPICLETRQVVRLAFPNEADNEIPRITQIMFFCDLLATGMAD
jgi:hypothetical protein